MSARGSLPLDPPTGRVCVVVPAHNESRVIAGLVRSLRAETYPDMRVVLALDRCTDDTASLARAEIGDDRRFEIVEIDACPPEWVGKVHALHAGVTRSRGAADADYLLFADADTSFAPGCIAASLALMRERKLDLLSLLSTLSFDTWFERIVQPAATLELMRQYPLTLANAATDRRPFANGQFMLFTREAYEDIGGHEAVKIVAARGCRRSRGSSTRARDWPACFSPTGSFIAACTASGRSSGAAGSASSCRPPDATRATCRLSAQRMRWLGTLLPLWMLGAAPVGVFLVPREPVIGWTLVALGLRR